MSADMTTRAPYSYVLLRYRHDPLAGEFANVGVIVHQPSSRFLDAKIRHTLGRLSAMFPDIDGEALRSSLRAIERELKHWAESQGGAPEVIEETRIEDLVRRIATEIQQAETPTTRD
jgi:hypothetical protein